jgi:ferric-dicitrate binding protein FerR (iron transport regulator)
MSMEKINSIFKISELIARDASGQLNQTEKDTLGKWIKSSEQNQLLYRRIVDGSNLSARNSLYESVDTKKAWNKLSKELMGPQRSRVRYLLIRYAAIIMIPLLIGGAAYLYLNDKTLQGTHQFSEILPATSHAVLVLANGKNVNLSNDSTRNLVEVDGSLIKNTRKELSYAKQLSNNSKETLLNTLIVPQGGEYKLVLSDGTRISVNSMSKLVYPVNFMGNTREVALEGEALFEVSKDKSKPFIVTIKGMKVEVLGTTFNIKAYPDDNQSFTTLVEGRIKLNSGFQSSNESFLEPDQQAVYDPSTTAMAIQKVDAKQFVQWTTGRYAFTNQPLGEIMKTLSRWYDFNYRFEDESLKQIRFEGGLNKYESIDPILDIILETGKVKVTVKGKEVLFSKI